MSDPITTRLDRRREELVRRVELLVAEAAGAGEWSEGASLALHAAWDEARHFRELYSCISSPSGSDEVEDPMPDLPWRS